METWKVFIFVSCIFFLFDGCRWRRTHSSRACSSPSPHGCPSTAQQQQTTQTRLQLPVTPSPCMLRTQRAPSYPSCRTCLERSFLELIFFFFLEVLAWYSASHLCIQTHQKFNTNSPKIQHKHITKFTHREHTQQGKPIVRPLYWADPTDEKTWTVRDQFLLGEKVGWREEEGVRTEVFYYLLGIPVICHTLATPTTPTTLTDLA